MPKVRGGSISIVLKGGGTEMIPYYTNGWYMGIEMTNWCQKMGAYRGCLIIADAMIIPGGGVLDTNVINHAQSRRGLYRHCAQRRGHKDDTILYQRTVYGGHEMIKGGKNDKTAFNCKVKERTHT